MTARRCLLLLVAACAAWAPPPAWAQPAGRLPLVGILSLGSAADKVCRPNDQGGNAGCLIEALRALGYTEGRNIAFEYRFAQGAAGKLPALATELVSQRPDVIYTYTTAGADAAASATATIPIIVGPAGERLFDRLAGNFARPQRNVTGLTLGSQEQDQKCLQLLKELVPRIARVAVLANPDNPNTVGNLEHLRRAAGQLGLTLIRVDARNVDDLAQAFANIRASRADAIFIGDDAPLAGSAPVRQRIIQWALGQRLPVASSNARVAPDGGLVSLGTDVSALARRAAFYVHRVLGGATASDLPVERPTIFKLAVNRKTAAALGLTVPQTVLMRADEVIE